MKWPFPSSLSEFGCYCFINHLITSIKFNGDIAVLMRRHANFYHHGNLCFTNKLPASGQYVKIKKKCIQHLMINEIKYISIGYVRKHLGAYTCCFSLPTVLCFIALSTYNVLLPLSYKH